MDATIQHATTQPASQIAFCQELIELGMQMARAAAAQAAREAEEETAAIPPARRRTRDPNLAFIRISRELRQLAALVARLAAGTAVAPTFSPEAARPAPKPRAPEPPAAEPPAPEPLVTEPPACITPATPGDLPQPDPRRATLYAAADLITQRHPYRDQVRAACTNMIEIKLLADKRRKTSPADMLITIADTLHLDIDSIDFPDTLMEQLIHPAFNGPTETRQAA